MLDALSESVIFDGRNSKYSVNPFVFYPKTVLQDLKKWHT